MCDTCRIAVFSITVLHDERIVVVAEQRPDSTEEDSFQWMSRVLQVRPTFVVLLLEILNDQMRINENRLNVSVEAAVGFVFISGVKFGFLFQLKLMNRWIVV